MQIKVNVICKHTKMNPSGTSKITYVIIRRGFIDTIDMSKHIASCTIYILLIKINYENLN